MMYNKIMKKLCIFYILIFCCTVFFGCNFSNQPKFVKGVWWWDYSLDQTYLDFAIDNDVNEIYFCDSDFENTYMVQNMVDNNIDVYWLVGDKQWLLDFDLAKKTVEQFVNYSDNYLYSGIHMDVEPHQFDDFEDNRTQYIYSLIDLAYYLKETFPEIKFDYDIPFWFDDEITFNGATKPAYAHMIDIANRTFLMSYRDSANAMLEVSKEELEYAKNINKIVILGAETAKSDETDIVSYYEEGKTYMNEQLQIVCESLPNNYGISIHHIKSWEQLKN